VNDEHLKILKQGVAAWNKWRAENRVIVPDLSGANLGAAGLSGAGLSGADLSGADLSKADLSGADLSGAYLTESMLRWANLRDANLHRADLTGASLSDANLSGATLSGAILSTADLGGADLSDADLRDAYLGDAYLSDANLSTADLSDANLDTANLQGAKLDGANLTRAELGRANLSGAYLSGADLSGANLGWTIFADVDLSEVKGMETVRHQGPSTIGIDTLYESGGKINEFFLRGCGVPEEFISYIPSHIGARQAIQFYSCFISHSVKDKRFCERLYADLQAKQVRVWYFPEDAKWGEPVWGEIDKCIKIYDKLVVVCSKNSLQSGPVLREIQRALNREDHEGRNVLFPVRIDDHIFKTWEHERKADVLSKVVGNFTGWHRSAAKYEEAFEKLLSALQAVGSKG